MAKGQRKVAGNKSELVARLPVACRDEVAAVELIEELFWGDDPRCPHEECASRSVYKMRDRKTGERNKRFLWRCKDCNRQFSVRKGTILEDSPIPFTVWCHAFWSACASKKGISAKQIQRETGLSYRSALFMMHRIRYAMSAAEGYTTKLSGIVEVDETYVGGKPRYAAGVNPATGKRRVGRGTRKTPVMAMVERGGDVRLSRLERITAPKLIPAIWEAVDQSNTTIMTDELGAYNGVGRRVSGGHFTVKHSAGQYVDGRNGEVHSNTVESVFSLIKRGLIGTYHSVSKHRLPLYLSEFEYKWNTRWLDDGARTAKAIRQAQGKRLTYLTPMTTSLERGR